MKIRYYNALILKDADSAPFAGELWIDGDRIAKILKAGEAGSDAQFDREIDCEGHLLMPGFKDAHTHSPMTFLRSNADDLPLDAWLNTQVFPYEAKLTKDDIYELTKVAVLEYLTSGITGVMEMYMQPESIARACDEMGMRLVQVGASNNFSHTPEEVGAWYESLNGVSPLTSYRLGFHAEYTCSPELLGKIADLAHKYEAPVFTHVAETKSETEGCIARYGKTPVAFLAQEGIFDFGGAGYHMVHVTDDDIAIMKEKGIAAVTNPASNCKLASGIAPLSKFLAAGIPVGIGTDGPASNNCLDMFREMFLATALAKILENDAAALPAGSVLNMAITDGARIMGIPDADSLAEGKLADMILIDMQQPNMQPVSHIANNVVYSGSKLNVVMTVIGGNILYNRIPGSADAGRFDERGFSRKLPAIADIYAKAQSIRDRIIGE